MRQSVFFEEVQLHGELADLELQRSDLGFALGDGLGLVLLLGDFAVLQTLDPQDQGSP